MSVCSFEVYGSRNIQIKGYSQEPDWCKPIKSDEVIYFVDKKLNERSLSLKPVIKEGLQYVLNFCLFSKYSNVTAEIGDWDKGSFSLTLQLEGDRENPNLQSAELNCIFKQDTSSNVERLKDVSCLHKATYENGTLHYEILDRFDLNPVPVTDYLKVGAGLASTIFFTYKAYQETRKIFEESKKPELESKAPTELPAVSSEHNESAPKASPWRALAYTAAAVGSGIFSAYAFQDL